MDYSFLRDQYPEIITMDQLYHICHISKRKARWLLENGIIPCEDSGKKTRRFKIKLEDVIEFLEFRDAGLLDDMIPVGIFSGEEYGYPPRPAPHTARQRGLTGVPSEPLGGFPRYADRPSNGGPVRLQCGYD